MNNILKKLSIFFRDNFKDASEDAEFLFIPYSIFSMIFFVAFYAANGLGCKFYEQEVFGLRLLSILLCVLLSLKNYWPVKFQYLKIYIWYLLLVITIPTFDFYLTLVNSFDGFVLMDFFVGIFQIMILTNIFTGFILVLSGVLLSTTIFSCVYDIKVIKFSSLFVHDIIYTVYVAIFSAFLLYLREKSRKYKLNAAENLANVIAHEMRTPLRTIASYAQIIKRYLPKLIANNIVISKYIVKNPEITNELRLEYIDPENYKTLYDSINTIREETKNSFLVIDMILMQISIKSNFDQSVSLISIKQLIEDSIRRYNFFPSEKTLLHLNIISDFLLLGNSTLLLHVIFNLFKNSLYIIKKYNKGAIYIWTNHNRKYNELHFRDTSMGIKSDTLPFIFNSFFSSKNCSSGLGLSYCKQAMESIHGKIECRSEYGKYTEFILYFPFVTPN